MTNASIYESKRVSSENHVFKIKNNRKNIGSIKPAIFFDRDGVLIEDKHYISCRSQVVLHRGLQKILSKSSSCGWLNIVMTNQSGIYRGFLTWDDYEKITMKMLELIGKPFKIDAIYANGASPNELLSSKSWRKPNPNMILEAAKDFNIDIKNSILVGDRLTDFQAGQNAGIKKFVHVLTGHGKNERESILNMFKKLNNQKNLFIVDDLSYFPISLISNIKH